MPPTRGGTVLNQREISQERRLSLGYVRRIGVEGVVQARRPKLRSQMRLQAADAASPGPTETVLPVEP
jgi:hypothetical protein